MTALIAGLVIFFSVHIALAATPINVAMTARLGPGGRRGAVALMSLIGLGLIVWGKANAAFEPIWSPPAWGRHVVHLAMPFAFVLLAAAYMPSNQIRRLVRHPMLIAVCVWSAAHLLANGDRASILLFASFGIYGLFAIWAAAQRPPVNVVRGGPLGDVGAVLVGLIVYALVLHEHARLFGVAVIG